jgi:hypothetical protein
LLHRGAASRIAGVRPKPPIPSRIGKPPSANAIPLDDHDGGINAALNNCGEGVEDRRRNGNAVHPKSRIDRRRQDDDYAERIVGGARLERRTIAVVAHDSRISKRRRRPNKQ